MTTDLECPLQSNPGIRAWMAAANLSTAAELEQHYVARLLELASDTGAVSKGHVGHVISEGHVGRAYPCMLALAMRPSCPARVVTSTIVGCTSSVRYCTSPYWPVRHRPQRFLHVCYRNHAVLGPRVLRTFSRLEYGLCVTVCREVVRGVAGGGG